MEELVEVCPTSKMLKLVFSTPTRQPGNFQLKPTGFDSPGCRGS